MMFSASTTTSLAVAWLAITASAQTGAPLNSTVGCPEVNCPVDELNNHLSNCQVEDLSLQGVGISAYSASVLDYSPTWTLGVSLSNNSVQRTFYIGEPQSAADKAGITGCALFILANPGDQNSTLFDGGHANENRGWVGPSCSQPGNDGTVGLPEACVAELSRQASEQLGVDGSDCNDIAELFNSRIMTDCNPDGAPRPPSGKTSFLGQSSTVYAVPLTGDDAPKPISASANDTSNCWPTLPQSNQLAEVFAFNISRSDDATAAEAALRDITPVLSVWRDSDGETSFDASCISPLIVSTQDAATMSESLGAACGPCGWLALTVAFVLGAACLIV